MTIEELNPHGYAVTEEQKNNLALLAKKMTAIEALTERKLIVTSGLRSVMDQTRIDSKAGRKPTLGSMHLKGAACDILDADRSLQDWCLEHLYDEIQPLWLYLENFAYTRFPTPWVHFQVIPPKSGRIIFTPYASPAPTH